MKIFFPLAVLTFAITSTSCGNQTGKDKNVVIQNPYMDSVHRADSIAKYGAPVDLEFSTARDATYDGKRVTIIGYLNIPGNSYSTGNTGQLGFVERPNMINGAFTFILSIKLGKDKNTMKELPDKYTTEDVVVTGKSGEMIRAGDLVKVTGILRPDVSYCALDVQEIEKMEAAAIDYSTLNATKLTGPGAPGKEMEGKLVFAEGTLEMPMLSMGGKLTFLYLHVPAISEQIVVNIAYGKGSAKLEPLPEKYTDKDVHIQNSKGEYINMKKKVRLYGIWKNDGVQIESIDNV
ncbi:MAG: hypothetical protein ABIQ40_02305 [Bacteroidia bacterium]